MLLGSYEHIWRKLIFIGSFCCQYIYEYMKHSILGIVVLTFILSCSDGYKMKFPEERKGSIKYDKEIDISIPLEIIKSGNLLLYSDFEVTAS